MHRAVTLNYKINIFQIPRGLVRNGLGEARTPPGRVQIKTPQPTSSGALSSSRLKSHWTTAVGSGVLCHTLSGLGASVLAGTHTKLQPHRISS